MNNFNNLPGMDLVSKTNQDGFHVDTVSNPNPGFIVMKQKKCDFCGGNIDVNKKSRRFCSKECSHKYWTKERSYKIISRTCAVCEKVFNPFSPLNKYCSCKCHREGNRKPKKIFKPIKCEICNIKFIPISTVNKYCSIKCKNTSDVQRRSKKPIIKTCKYCQLKFKPYTSLDKYCSAQCRINNQKSKRTRNWSKDKANGIIGENNPSYRNGYYVRSNKKTTKGERLFQANAKKIKDEMIIEHGRIYCQNCNTFQSIRFESHHIIFRSEKPLHPKLHDPSNIIVLCIECHNEFHRTKSKRDQLVKDRGLDKRFMVATTGPMGKKL